MIDDLFFGYWNDQEYYRRLFSFIDLYIEICKILLQRIELFDIVHS
jgi:hypothetical protein